MKVHPTLEYQKIKGDKTYVESRWLWRPLWRFTLPYNISTDPSARVDLTSTIHHYCPLLPDIGTKTG